MSGHREIGTPVNCLLCDNYFLAVIGTAPSWAAVRGKAGTKILNDLLEKLQLETAARPWRLAYCPSCVTLQTGGMKYSDWLSKHPDDAPPVEFSLCRFVEFETNSQHPLYHNPASAKGDGARPRWELVQGVGPPTLELAGRSIRIVKATLRQYDIRVNPQYPPRDKTAKGQKLPETPDPSLLEAEHLNGETHLSVAKAVAGTLWRTDIAAEEIDALCESWTEQRPLYLEWGTVLHTIPPL